jgi:phage gp46-like protein
MLVRIRDTEGCERQPHLAWDTVWVQRLDASGGYGDWLLAGPEDQPESRGGLRAEAALHTATMLLLFTDARAPAEATLPDDSGDRRGWWGDSIRLDGEPEAPLGSLIWLEVERGVLSEETALKVKDHAEEALAVLVSQGAVARTLVETEARPAEGLLGLSVEHFSHAGETVYSQRFQILWQQSLRNAPMNFGEGIFAHAV